MPCLPAQLQTVAQFEVQNTSGTYDQAVKLLQQIEEATTYDDSTQSLQCKTPSKLIPTGIQKQSQFQLNSHKSLM